MELESIAGKKIPVLPHHLEQILLILLDNAVKYSTNQKNILIRGSLQENRLQIEVIDKGMGIPKAYLPYVFDRFYRVDKARSRLQGGNGLGLSIAKRLVEKYHGSIHIDSSEDHGTGVILTFSILKEIKLI
jgi:two-component system sensor histidine kinase ArlS